MRNKKNIFGSLILLAFSSCAFGQLTILSGSKQATQYQYIQDIVNVVAPSLDFMIANESTLGSSYNIKQLIDTTSKYKVALVQSDYLYYMQTQDMRMNTQKTKNLKVLIPLGYEQIHLVTKNSKGYKGLKDVNEKMVAIGSADQGTYTTATLIKERSQVLYTTKNTHFNDCFGELNTDKIDAFFVVGSAPIPKLDVNPQSMVDKLALVPLMDFNDWAKYYKRDTIYKSEYKWLDQDVPTYSVRAVIVVNEKKLTATERTQVMQLRSAIQNKYEQLKKTGHSAWKKIDLWDWQESDWPYFK